MFADDFMDEDVMPLSLVGSSVLQTTTQERAKWDMGQGPVQCPECFRLLVHNNRSGFELSCNLCLLLADFGFLGVKESYKLTCIPDRLRTWDDWRDIWPDSILLMDPIIAYCAVIGQFF